MTQKPASTAQDRKQSLLDRLRSSRLLRTDRRGLREDRGFGLVELSVAMGVLSIAMMGAAAAMGTGLRAAGQARQRSVASALAAQQIERARHLPYEQVALDQTPTHVSDPAHPDWYVTQQTPVGYDVQRDGTVLEPLIVGGSIQHAQGPVVRGSTKLDVYQYVSWVDDPTIPATQDYKRVTVVATWRSPLLKGASASVVASTFVAPGAINLPQATPAPVSAALAPTPTPSPTAAPSCAGDTSAPSGTLEVISGSGGASAYASSTVVQVRLQATDGCQALHAELSNDGVDFTPVGDLASGVASTVAWTVASGDGWKIVHARFRDGAGNISPVFQAQTVLDQTKPTVPGSLRRANCTLTGSNRTVLLTWDASVDANLSGYRLYRSSSSGDWQLVATISTQQVEDTTRKSLDAVRYLVRASDRAGNESGDSNVLTLAKNSC